MKGRTESRQRRMTLASFLTIMLRQTVVGMRRELGERGHGLIDSARVSSAVTGSYTRPVMKIRWKIASSAHAFAAPSAKPHRAPKDERTRSTTNHAERQRISPSQCTA